MREDVKKRKLLSLPSSVNDNTSHRKLFNFWKRKNFFKINNKCNLIFLKIRCLGRRWLRWHRVGVVVDYADTTSAVSLKSQTRCGGSWPPQGGWGGKRPPGGEGWGWPPAGVEDDRYRWRWVSLTASRSGGWPLGGRGENFTTRRGYRRWNKD